MKNRILDVLPSIDLESLEVEQLLENRDVADFDTRWISAYECVKAHGDLADQAELDQVREEAFKFIFAQLGDPEMAAVVSDDLGLIMAAAILDFHDGWINSLWLEYSSGRIPAGALAVREGRLRDMLSRAAFKETW